MRLVEREKLEALGTARPSPPREKHRSDPSRNGHEKEFQIAGWIQEHGISVRREGAWDNGGYRWILEECPWNGHADNAAYIVQHSNGAVSAGCHHNSCQGYGWRDLRKHYEPVAYESQDNFKKSTETDGESPATGPGRNGVYSVSRNLPTVESFPVNALPKGCRRLVKEAAAAIGCPMDFIGLPVLVTLGSAIGNSRVLRLKRGWEEGATIYGSVVAEPGEKKSPAFAVATNPAWIRQAEYRHEYKKAMDEYRLSKETGVDSEEVEEPNLQRTVIEDTTVEALIAVLEENPRGLLNRQDELSGWFSGLNQYKGGKGADRQRWLSNWSNSPVVVDRKGRKEPLTVPRPFAGLTGSIQPTVLSELKDNREDGMLDRFLVVYPDSVPSRWTDDEISDGARVAYKDLYYSLRTLHMPEDDNGDPEPKRISLAPDAKEVLVEAINDHREEMDLPGFPPYLKGPWSKLEAYIARLCLVLTMARAVSDGAPEKAEARDVLAAVVFVNYFKSHARRVYAILHGEDKDELLAEDVARFLLDRGGRFRGQPDELHEQLESRFKPPRSAELSKKLKTIAGRHPTIVYESGQEAAAGPNGRTTRRFVGLTLEIGVNPVNAVNGDARRA